MRTPVAASRSEVERCRSAAWTDPVSLATALDQLASRLSEVGRHDERLTAIDESTAIWRELTAADPETARPGTALPERDSPYAGLAWALENRAYALSDLDRHEEAVDPIVEAVAIRRRLEVSDSVRSASALARALRSESNMMRRVGRLHDAVEGLHVHRDASGAPTAGANRPRSPGTSLWEPTPRGPPPPLRRGPGEHGGSSWSRWPGCRASGFGSVRAPRRGEGCRPDVTPALPSGEAAYEMDLQLGRVHSASFGSLRLLSNQCARPLEDLVEHRPGEPTGEGVLLARMV